MYFFTFKPFKHTKFIFFPRWNPVIPDKGVGENVDLASIGTIRKGTIITACRCSIKNKLTEYLLCCPNTFTLENPVMTVPLIRKGNSIFYLNENIPDIVAERFVDRIVVEPEIPI